MTLYGRDISTETIEYMEVLQESYLCAMLEILIMPKSITCVLLKTASINNLQ